MDTKIKTKANAPIIAPRTNIPRGTTGSIKQPSTHIGSSKILSPSKDAVAAKGMSSKK